MSCSGEMASGDRSSGAVSLHSEGWKDGDDDDENEDDGWMTEDISDQEDKISDTQDGTSQMTEIHGEVCTSGHEVASSTPSSSVRHPRHKRFVGIDEMDNHRCLNPIETLAKVSEDTAPVPSQKVIKAEKDIKLEVIIKEEAEDTDVPLDYGPSFPSTSTSPSDPVAEASSDRSLRVASSLWNSAPPTTIFGSKSLSTPSSALNAAPHTAVLVPKSEPNLCMRNMSHEGMSTSQSKETSVEWNEIPGKSDVESYTEQVYDNTFDEGGTLCIRSNTGNEDKAVDFSGSMSPSQSDENPGRSNEEESYIEQERHNTLDEEGTLYKRSNTGYSGGTSTSHSDETSVKRDENPGRRNEEESYTEQVCEKTFYQKGTLHIRSNTGKDDIAADNQTKLIGPNPHSREYLSQLFHIQNDLFHQTEIPTRVLPVEKDCRIPTSLPDILSSHRLKQVQEKQFQVCGTVLSNESSLNCPMQLHTGKKAHKCDECGISFSHPVHLADHMKTHTKGKPFKCPECGKVVQSDCFEHMLTHTGKKPYICQECGKEFTHYGSLVVHKMIHTREKPLVCQECGYVTALQCNFAQHMITHKKLYKCQECGHAFARRCDLVRHMKIHIGKKPGFAGGTSTVQSKKTSVEIAENPGRSNEEKSYLEQVCDKTFEQELTRHIKCNTGKNDVTVGNKTNLETKQTHAGEKPHKCQECGKAFSKYFSLVRHMRVHTGEKPHKCRECGKAFSTDFGLVQHMRVHTGEKTHKCPECGRAFVRRSDLVNHIRTHTGEMPYKCQECDHAFARRTNLVQHMKIHTGVNQYKCGDCDRTFRYKSNMVRHRRIHNGEKPVSFSFPGGMSTSQSEETSAEWDENTGRRNEEESCIKQVCDKTFDQQGTLHIRSNTDKNDIAVGKKTKVKTKQHTGGKQYKCQECGKSFGRPCRLASHMKKHTEERSFIHSAGLADYIKTHSGEKPYTCRECGLVIERRSHLIKHIRTHTGEKPYKCQECDYASATRSSLVQHMRIHTGEKPYICQDCGKAFRNTSNLAEHRRIHSAKKPYKCQDCGELFRYKKNIIEHRRIHTGKKARHVYITV